MSAWAPLLLVTGTLLAEGPPLVGTVVDSAGQAVVDARVDIATAAPRIGKPLFCPSCYLDCKKTARTNPLGLFALADLSPALKFRLLVTAPGKKPVLTPLIDPLGDESPRIVLADRPKDLPPARTVLGTVVDDQGMAIAGALIEPSGAKTSERRWWGAVDAQPDVSDGDGQFVLSLPEGYQGVDVDVIADGFAGVRAELLAPGDKPHRILVPSGTRVTGRLVLEGKPAEGIRIAVVQLDRSGTSHFIKAVGTTSDADGRFAFDSLPASEGYAIFTLVGEGAQEHVLTTKKFKALGNRQERNLGELALTAPLKLAGTVTLPDGKLLPPDATITLGREPAWDLIAVPIDEAGRFAIEGLPPETYEIAIRVGGIKVDQARLPFQVLSDQSFGIRLEESLLELEIPLLVTP